MSVTATVPETEADIAARKKRQKIEAFLAAFRAGITQRGTPIRERGGDPERMLLPQLGLSLSLVSETIHDDDTDRFIACYRRAWDRLPDHVRAWLRHRWTGSKPDQPAVAQVALVGGMVCDRDEYEPPGAYNAETEGYLFGWTDLCGEPDEKVESVIAHEWAHSYLHQRGQNTRDEEAVHELTQEWGFAY